MRASVAETTGVEDMVGTTSPRDGHRANQATSAASTSPAQSTDISFWDKRARVISVTLAVILAVLFGIWTYLATVGDAYYKLFIAIGVVTVIQLVIRYYAPGTHLEPTEDNLFTTQTRGSAVRNLVDYAAGEGSLEFGAPVLALYADMLLDPPTFRSRTVERLQFSKGTTFREVLTRFSFADPVIRNVYQPTNQVRLLIPLLVPPKGRLYDGERIEDDHGTLLSPLTVQQSLKVNATVLLYMFRNAYGLPTAISAWADPFSNNFLDLLEFAATSASSRPNPALVRATINSILAPDDPARNSPAFLKLTDFAILLSERYVIVVSAEARSEITLTYRHEVRTNKLSTRSPDSQATALTRWTQSLFRIPSGHIRVSMAQARRCQSFHLYVVVPDGSYIGPVSASLGAAALELNSHPELMTTTPYLRPIHASGSTLHIYGRGLRDVPSGAQIQGRVYERPYGSELFGAISCLAFLAFAIVLRESFQGGEHTDPGAVLLAVPVGLATISAFFAAAIRRSLTASTAGVVSGLLASSGAVVSVFVYLLQEAASDLTDSNAIGANFWRIVVSLATVLAAASTGAFLLRLLRFISRLRKLSSRLESDDV